MYTARMWMHILKAWSQIRIVKLVVAIAVCAVCRLFWNTNKLECLLQVMRLPVSSSFRMSLVLMFGVVPECLFLEFEFAYLFCVHIVMARLCTLHVCANTYIYIYDIYAVGFVAVCAILQQPCSTSVASQALEWITMSADSPEGETQSM